MVSAVLLQLLQGTWRHHPNPLLKLTIWRGDWHRCAVSESDEPLKKELICNTSSYSSTIYVKLFICVGKQRAAHETVEPI